MHHPISKSQSPERRAALWAASRRKSKARRRDCRDSLRLSRQAPKGAGEGHPVRGEDQSAASGRSIGGRRPISSATRGTRCPGVWCERIGELMDVL